MSEEAMGMTERRQPILWLREGDTLRGVFGLTTAQYRSVHLTLRRYYRWLDSGKRDDPWSSGVSHGVRYDAPRVRTSAPASSGPGRYAPSEPDNDLVTIDRLIASLEPHQQRLARWKAVGDGSRPLTTEIIAERLQIGVNQVKADWQRLAVRLYYVGQSAPVV